MVQVCIDKLIPGKEPTKYTKSGPSADATRSGASARMALIREKMWDVGATIRVRFMEGQSDVQQKVKKYALSWMEYANVNLVFVPSGDAEIRIGFNMGDGSWSYIGRDALDIPKNERTMNYGWLKPNTPDDEYSRVVIHEFGHALGAIHEHQNPAGNIPWDKEAVYKYYMGPPNNWSKKDIDHNLFARYSKTITNFTKFDPKSIMLYPIPAEFTTNHVAIGARNTTPSHLDKKFMSEQYPRIKT